MFDERMVPSLTFPSIEGETSGGPNAFGPTIRPVEAYWGQAVEVSRSDGEPIQQAGQLSL